MIGAVGLAINAAAERDGFAEVCDRIVGLLSCARDLWRMVPELENDADRAFVSRTTYKLIHLADIESLTTHA